MYWGNLLKNSTALNPMKKWQSGGLIPDRGVKRSVADKMGLKFKITLILF